MRNARLILSLGRLMRMQKPRIGNWRKVDAAPQNNKSKGKGKGRTAGKLARLTNMPLDIFFEVSIPQIYMQNNIIFTQTLFLQIASRLMPIDLLHLSMVSKEFRLTFASQRSRHIWMAARKRVVNLPDCPFDLNEPQYAALVFGRHCQVCLHLWDR